MARHRASGSSKTQERFSTVPPSRVPRSAFDRSFSHKSTIDSGFLYPLFHDEVLPGDTITVRPAFFARMATPLKPFMDGLHLDYQFFFTPLRLVWDNFVRMMGERPDPADHNDYTVPQMISSAGAGHAVGTLSDYLGIPTDIVSLSHSSLYHRTYNLIHREWYRDENLQDPVMVDMDDGTDAPANYVLLRRGKRKDYFTGALPFAQKGTAVSLPLGTSAPLVGTLGIDGVGGPPTFDVGADLNNKLSHQFDNGVNHLEALAVTNVGDALWNDTQLEVDLTAGTADLSAATAATINDIRTAIGIQHLLERDARGGTRYREQVLAHFGVHTDDIRLMRPELLATGSTPVQVSLVPQTAGVTGGGTELGDLGAYATAQSVGRGFTKTFTEHGIIMGIISIRAELTYQQGLHRAFARDSRYEFFWPDLANLGEQAVISQEIWSDGTGSESAQTGDWSVWGYQPRYEEYRHRHSMITGEFRSQFVQSLDVWHLGLDFATRPVLNAAFIVEQPHVDRVVIDQTAPQFLIDCFFKVTHVRPMPKFGTPGMTRF